MYLIINNNLLNTEQKQNILFEYLGTFTNTKIKHLAF